MYKELQVYKRIESYIFIFNQLKAILLKGLYRMKLKHFNYMFKFFVIVKISV